MSSNKIGSPKVVLAKMNCQPDNSHNTTKKARKRKEQKSDEDSSSREYGKKKPAAEDKEKENPLLPDWKKVEKKNIKTPQTTAQPSPEDKQEDTDEEMISEMDSSSSSETDSEDDQTTKEKEKATHTKRDREDEIPETPEIEVNTEYLRAWNKRSYEWKYESITEKRYDGIMECIRSLITTIEALENERDNLKLRLRKAVNNNTRLDKIEDAITKMAKIQAETNRAPQKQMTYAEKLRSPGSNLAEIRSAAPLRHVITIYPKDESNLKSSEDTKKAVMSSFAPSKDKLKIRSVKKIANNGVLIETTNKDDATRMLQSGKLTAAGLVAGLPEKKRPRVIIYNVPTDTSDKDFLTALRNQNLAGMDKGKQREEIKISHKTGNRNAEINNWVLEVTPDIRNALLKQDKVYLGWICLRIRDYVNVSRCYKCQEYGHVSKYCRATKDTCGHCGRDGHKFKDCPNTEKDAICITCKRRGREHNHSSRSPECPAYKIAMENEIARTEYDTGTKQQMET